MSNEINISEDKLLAKLKLTSSDAALGRQKRKLARDIMEGLNKMRSMSTTYLYKDIDEAEEDYTARLTKRTSLSPAFKKTIEDIVNKIFIKKISFSYDTEDERVDTILNNIDKRSNDLNEFAKKIAHNCLVNGIWFVEVNVNTAILNQQKFSFKSIDCNDVNWYKLDDEGKIELFSYNVKTYETNPETFEEELVEYIYCYQLKNDNITLADKDYVVMTTYRKTPNSDYVGKYTVLSNITQIPVVPFYFDAKENEKLLNADVPLNDMADKTLLHWNKYSYYDNLVTISAIPFLNISGLRGVSNSEDAEEVKLSAKKIMAFEDTDAKVSWVVQPSDSSTQIKELVDRIENEMKVMGSEFLDIQKSFSTATEAVLNSLDTASKASNFAIQLEKSLKKCFEIAFEFIALNTNFELEVNKNVQIFKDEEVFRILDGLHSKNIISDSQFIEYINKMKLLGFEIDEEKRKELLEKEGKLFNTDINNLNNMLNQEQASEDNQA
jgi:hypothetical protein